MKTYEAVARTLVGCGLKTMFGLMGDANMQYIVDYMQHAAATTSAPCTRPVRSPWPTGTGASRAPSVWRP